MSDVATALPQMIDALISTLSSASSLSGVRVFDGPEIDGSYPGDFIAVGHDGTDDGDVQAGSGRQQYLELGNRRQFEDGSVSCFLAAWDGGTSLAARRVRAFALLSAIDTLIRSDPSFGGVCLYSSLDSYAVNYRQTDLGAAVVIDFSVAYKART